MTVRLTVCEKEQFASVERYGAALVDTDESG